jgi:DNA-binding transcriptional MerR regulator
MAKMQRRVGGPAWTPGDPTLTVGEIAERLSPIAPDVSGTVQRIRHWTREQMLLPVDQLHAGTGKHRQYSADAVYDAAILHIATNAGLNISSQRYLVDALTKARIAVPKWKGERDKGRARPLYLRIDRSANRTDTTGVEILWDDAGKPSDDLTIIIDLARLFARVGG